MVSFKDGMRLAAQSLWRPLLMPWKYAKFPLFAIPFIFLNLILLFLESPTAFFRIKQNLYPFSKWLPEKAFSVLNSLFETGDYSFVYQNSFMEFIKSYRFIFVCVLTLILAALSVYFVYDIYQSTYKRKILFRGKMLLVTLWIFLPVLWAGGILVKLDFFKHLQLIGFVYSLGTPIILDKGYSITSFLNAFFDTLKNAIQGYVGGWLIFGAVSLILFLITITLGASLFIFVPITYITLSGILFSVLMYEKSKE